jgi:hypothetical protein
MGGVVERAECGAGGVGEAAVAVSKEGEEESEEGERSRGRRGGSTAKLTLEEKKLRL